MQRDRNRHLLKKPQLFRKIGPNKYIPVYDMNTDENVYYWDEDSQRIVLKKPGQ